MKASSKTIGHAWKVGFTNTFITAAHALEGREVVAIEYLDGATSLASVIKSDVGADLALLRAAHDDRRPGLELASRRASIGQRVFLSARETHETYFSSGVTASILPGFVFRREVWDYWKADFVVAPVTPGTSGAAWVDDDGFVVGVQLGVARHVDGVAFFADLDAVRRFVADPRVSGTSSLRAMFSDEQPDASPVAYSGGVWIREVDASGPLGLAGLKPGSRILTVAGTDVRTVHSLLEAVRTHEPGSSVGLEVVESGSTAVRLIQVTPSPVH